MELTVQRFLFAMAMLAFAAGVVLAVAALRYYARYDIRGVRDDLSGRMRQRIMAEQRVYASLLSDAERPVPHRPNKVDDASVRRTHTEPVPLGQTDEQATLCHADHVRENDDDEAPTVISASRVEDGQVDFLLTTDIRSVHAHDTICGKWGVRA